MCRTSKKQFGAAAVVFGSVSAVERHKCDLCVTKARTVDIKRVFLNGIMTNEICIEISDQCLNVSIYGDKYSEKVYSIIIFKHGSIVPCMARPDR